MAEWSDPWAGEHRAWGGATYGNMARNLVRYDVAQTRLGLIASTGAVAADDFEYYYHHPPLNVWAAAASSWVFGVSEASARAVSLAASLACIALLYWLTSKLYSRRAGLAAAALLALMPGEVFYGDHLDPYSSLSLFFALLAVAGYARWQESAGRGDLALCIAGVTGGCLTTWTPYFAVPLIFLHAAVTIPRAQWRERAGLLALPVCAVAAFAFFVLHRQMLLGSVAGTDEGELYGSLLEKLVTRGAWAGWFGAEGPSALEGWEQHGLDAWKLFTPLPLVLLGAWTFGLLRRAAIRRVSAADGILGILLGYGLLHSLAFPGTLHGHDFLVRCYAAGVAMAGGAVVAQVWEWLQAKGGRGVGIAMALAALALWCAVALPRIEELRVREWDPVEIVLRAREIRLATEAGTLLLVAGRPNRVLQYYIDRPMEFGVNGPGRLRALNREGRDVVWLVPQQHAQAVARSLANLEFSRRRVAGLLLVRLGADD